ncbi:DUF6270 domain-containing protein [Virgibacillus sp. LDC-1]|uniref:DUF6270 domain-containing protein n=1 Tax=Virgibacillus sp. LDC-1 TaxID=3039856 RepID=UPI0024DE7634|nr:DUF6270 domain-containing protein [Virgibacillus sp. LDC-1]
MRPTVSIIGSCITRDNFNGKFNPNHKMFFQCKTHQNQASFLSVMSQPFPLEVDVSDKSHFDQKHIIKEFDKTFLEEIIRDNPDYLLIDFYGDVYYGVTEVHKGTYITSNDKFFNIPIMINKKAFTIKDDIYFDIWKEKINVFFSWVSENLPNTKVILVKGRFSETLIDGRNLNEVRKQSGMRTINIAEMNNLWDKLDTHVENKYKVDVIDLTEQYNLSTNHPWGTFYVHYTMDYYRDFLNKMQRIAWDDNIKKLRFYENESLTHNIKRRLLKIHKLNKINNLFKRASR